MKKTHIKVNLEVLIRKTTKTAITQASRSAWSTKNFLLPVAPPRLAPVRPREARRLAPVRRRPVGSGSLSRVDPDVCGTLPVASRPPFDPVWGGFRCCWCDSGFLLAACIDLIISSRSLFCLISSMSLCVIRPIEDAKEFSSDLHLSELSTFLKVQNFKTTCLINID